MKEQKTSSATAWESAPMNVGGEGSHRYCQAQILWISCSYSSNGIYRKWHVRKRCSTESTA